jgi:two-component system sensor kinase FixL
MPDARHKNELERAEQRLALAARANGDLICDWDVTTGAVTRVGETAALGLAAEGSLQEWTMRLHPEERARVAERLQDALATGADRWSDEYRLRRPDGSYASVSEKACIVRTRQGMARRVVGVLHDVSNGKEAEDELRRLQAELIRMSQVHAMTAATTILAHELNQPLAAAANYLAGAKLVVTEMDGDLAGEAVRELEDAEGQIQRAGEIIRRIRLLSGKREPSHRLAASVSAVMRKMEPLLQAVGACPAARIRYELDPAADEIRADPIQLEQILMNLIRNACDAGGPASPVELTVCSRLVADGRVEIAVRDKGAGLSEEMLQSLFTGGGLSATSGLGLPIARAIVEGLGGKLWAENNEEKGASFYFTAPLLGGAG